MLDEDATSRRLECSLDRALEVADHEFGYRLRMLLQEHVAAVLHREELIARVSPLADQFIHSTLGLVDVLVAESYTNWDE